MSQILKNKKKARYGASCMFVPISSTRGVKLYATKSECDFAFYMQQKASEKKLGPKVFEAFSIRTTPISRVNAFGTRITFRYGYVTQIAKPVKQLTDKKLKTLLKRLNKNGFSVDDIHYGNIGYLGHNLVCIDFDLVSQQARAW